MPQRDAEGYIIIKDYNSPSFSSSVKPEETIIIGRLASIQSSLVTISVTVIEFLETRLFTKQTFKVLSKYFLYPLLSGAFSATLIYLRRRRH